MFSTTTFIRRHFALLPKGVLVTTRALLCHGRRAAVDQCLSRMVKEGRIVRVARGVFMRTYGDITVKLPSVYEVAQTKAQAFGKKIYTYGEDAAKHFGLSVGNACKSCAQTVFAIAGQTTSFKYGDIRITLKGTTPKYLKLGDSIPGLLIRGLMHAEIREGSLELIHGGPILVRREHKEVLWAAAGQMPWWLSNQLHFQWWNRAALLTPKNACN